MDRCVPEIVKMKWLKLRQQQKEERVQGERRKKKEKEMIRRGQSQEREKLRVMDKCKNYYKAYNKIKIS